MPHCIKGNVAFDQEIVCPMNHNTALFGLTNGVFGDDRARDVATKLKMYWIAAPYTLLTKVSEFDTLQVLLDLWSVKDSQVGPMQRSEFPVLLSLQQNILQ